MKKSKKSAIVWPDNQKHLVEMIDHLEEGLEKIVSMTTPSVYNWEKRVARVARKYLKEVKA